MTISMGDTVECKRDILENVQSSILDLLFYAKLGAVFYSQSTPQG